MTKIKSSLLSPKSLLPLFAKTLCMLSILFGLLACTSMDGYRDATADPDDRLDDLLILIEYQDSLGNECLDIDRPLSAVGDCGRIVVEVERILSDFPTHERTMMTLSILYYQMNRLDRAQYVLDQLLNITGTKPEAAILRSMIALKEGNVKLAASVLTRQILLAPENDELRSALASVYYSQGEIQRARTVLNMSSETNENQWLLSYHNGLLAETEKDWLAACSFYSNALRMQPNFGPARSRVIALAEFTNCSDNESIAAFLRTPIAEATPIRQAELTTYVAPIEAPASTVVASAIIEPQALQPEFPLQQLIEINTERLDQDNIIVNLMADVETSDVLMIQMNEPPRVILKIPNVKNSFGSAENTINDKLLDSISILSEGDNIIVTIMMRGNANIRMSNEQSILRLYFNESSESSTKL
jgi:tetratricopeptide (TPR) repeat protein